MDFSDLQKEISDGLAHWEPLLSGLTDEVISSRRNSQHRSIRQILGHMIDSASNNTHRIIHLQYQPSPFNFPNYATHGNNDRWIAIQNYQEEDWQLMVQLWKYMHLHLLHIIGQVDQSKLGQVWIAGPEEGRVSLRDMILDFPRHFKLHLDEVEALINQGVLWD